MKYFLPWQKEFSNETFFGKLANILRRKEDQVREWESEANRLLQYDPEQTLLELGFVGKSKIGKSTLINVLLNDEKFANIIPTGGVGPLTATSMRISYSDYRELRVTYHKANKLNNVLMSLEKIGTGTVESEEERQEKIKAKQDLMCEVKSILTGNQFSERDESYLLTMLQHLIKGTPPIELGTNFEKHPEDAVCYQKAYQAIKSNSARGDNGEFYFDENNADFFETVKDHAAGCLSPLVKSLELEWPSSFLQAGIAITDLPGVGVVGDSYPASTKEWILKKGHSVILVVDPSGLDESSTIALQNSDFFKRIMFSFDNPVEDPITLSIVVTHMDKCIQDIENPEEAALKFQDQTEKMKTVIRNQLISCFEKYLSETLSDDVRSARAAVVKRLESAIAIFPLSATEFRRIKNQSKHALLNSPDETGVPELQRFLVKQAGIYKEKKMEQIDRRANHLISQIEISLRQKVASLEIINGPALPKLPDEVKAEFDKFFKEHTSRLAARQGEFTGFMNETVPVEIEKIVAAVENTTLKQFETYLNTIRSAHWCTLKAAIRKNGTFDGARRIDIRQQLEDSFSEAVAVRFRTNVVNQMRDKARKLTCYNMESLDAVFQIVKKHKIPDIFGKKVHLLKEELQINLEVLSDLGEDRLKELSQAVRINLVDKIRDTIAVHCEAFINSPDAKGAKLKEKMLDLIHKAACDATEQAAIEVNEFLSDEFRSLYANLIEKDLKVHNRDLIRDLEELLRESLITVEKEKVESIAKENRALCAEILDLLESLSGEPKSKAS